MSVTIQKGRFYTLIGVAIIAFVLSTTALAIRLWSAPDAGRTVRLRIIMSEGEVIAEVRGPRGGSSDRRIPQMGPGTIVLRKGDHVVLEIVNPRKNIHSFATPAFGVNTGPLEPRDGSATVEFIAYQTGAFQYACATPHNDERGECDPYHEAMVGYLIVI